MSVGHVGMTLIGAIRNSLRKLAAVALSSTQIPHGMSRLALHLNRLLVESVRAIIRDKFPPENPSRFTEK